MGMKLGTLTSLLEFHDILASFKWLTDKEDHDIKRINDVRGKWKELDEVVNTAKADSEKKKEFERK
ncbi:hypothetical protein DAPPUDRAFT_249554 [Daphnia pulex]|uniref:Uncharacterized protein n=1 Tax=Daphnia pulex TaxID=6669 RepID=E9GWW5_DAPPU|nr:hypothetical protein DAPPUDRAFT_249554 [Daphnia pulex]|eukprot:EFX75973.1 hypothetical protein DAPPUDRAFT_249554 [Daphnia pulex]